MKCKGCRWFMSLSELDRGQFYCNRCEMLLLAKLARALRETRTPARDAFRLLLESA